ncbi:hypothetical protein DERF_004436 [Dermatophagoides farinae]|jgi:dCTP deaminase
MKDF